MHQASRLSTLQLPGDNGGIFVHDRDADGDGIFDEPGAVSTHGVSRTVSDVNVFARYPAISADGRFVAFASVATDLIPGDTNGVRDAFGRDRDPDGNGVFDEPGLATTERVSVGHPVLNYDGTVVAFLTRFGQAKFDGGVERNNVELYVHDRRKAYRRATRSPTPRTTART